MQLQETGYTFGSDQRLGIYLTNTLEEAAKKSERLIADWFADEANAAAKIKKVEPILVVLGNPPYSGHSANRSEITDCPAARRTLPKRRGVVCNGLPDGRECESSERHSSENLSRIISCGWKAARGKESQMAARRLREVHPFRSMADQRDWRRHSGIDHEPRLSRQSNISWHAATPYCRASTKSLYSTSTAIQRRRNVLRTAAKDNNVFDIQQGVAIILCVKQGAIARRAMFTTRTSGVRGNQIQPASESDVSQTAWAEVRPSSPFYLFVPQDAELRTEYERGMEDNRHPARKRLAVFRRIGTILRWILTEKCSCEAHHRTSADTGLSDTASERQISTD